MTSIAELVQAIKVYYSTIEGFLTSDPLLSNLRHMAGHIMRECHMYNSDSEFILCEKNGDVCADSLMNRHWEKLFGKVEELLYATYDSHNYHMLIQQIIKWSSDSEQHLKSFLKLHIIKYVQNVIEVMSSSRSALVDLYQWLVDRTDWIYVDANTIVDEAFEEALSDHPNLHDAFNAQVSVLCQLFK